MRYDQKVQKWHVFFFEWCTTAESLLHEQPQTINNIVNLKHKGKKIIKRKMSFPGKSLQQAWHLVDASNQTVGRLAGQISQILKGKHKPTFSPNKDMGDHVVVINAEKVRKKK